MNDVPWLYWDSSGSKRCSALMIRLMSFYIVQDFIFSLYLALMVIITNSLAILKNTYDWTATSSMDTYRCRVQDLPGKLYRVQYKGSQTTYENGGLFAPDRETFYEHHQKSAFASSIENNFTWSYRNPTPYINLFSDENHARNWSSRQVESCGTCDLLIVETSRLKNAHVFKLGILVRDLGLKIQNGADQHCNGAYICLHSIPSHAIKNAYSIRRGNMDCLVYCSPTFERWHFMYRSR